MGMRAESRNPGRLARGAPRQPHGRARRAPASSRMTNPVPPQCVHGPASNVSIGLLPKRRGRCCPWPAGLVEVALELLAFLGAVQLLQRLRLDLADPLARQPHHLADLLQGLRLSLVKPETQA